MVVAIDGPAGAGKSSVARALAEALGFTYLDSGAMYRAVALQSARSGKPAAEAARALDTELLSSPDIRTPEVSEAASRVATDRAVRAALVERQRELMSDGDWVAEGRDIGTVVAPDAAVKVFLTADPAERARRRASEIGADPEVVLRDQALRDEQDRTREHSPLRPAPGAIEVDTTGLSIPEVVERIVGLVDEAR
ncbi:MAG TPA: (d)CMP kinase [Thermoleophilaceae bacterium]|jgi:cytidylate kinase|nr:(d)CMP kinase [Thermoleophilaceae bacterium]